jgi:hypothetical protein
VNRRQWTLAALATSLFSGPSVLHGEEIASKIRIGTFDRTKLLVAFYASKTWDAKLRAMMAQRDEAKTAGNKKRVAALEAEGQALQEHAHRQLAGEATLKNIRESLEKVLPEVAKEANVQLIVEMPWYQDPSIEFVDVTDVLTKHLVPAREKKK